MNLTTKKWLAVASVAGVAATWGPQLASSDRTPARTTVDVRADGSTHDGSVPDETMHDAAVLDEPPDDGSLHEGPTMHAPVGAASVARAQELDVGDVGDELASDRPVGADLGAELDARVEAVRDLVTNDRVHDLDALATAWSRTTNSLGGTSNRREPDTSDTQHASAASSSASSAPANAPMDPRTSGAEAAVERVPSVPPTSAQILERFVVERPLDLILLGETRSCASLGSLLVREGDVLEGGIVVEAIGARTVLLRLGDERRRAKLAPFVARAKAVESAATPAGAPATTNTQPAQAVAPVIDAQALVRAAAEIGGKLQGAAKDAVVDPKAKEPKR